MPFLTVRMYAVSVRAGQVLQRIVSRKERKRYSVLLAAANGGRRGIAYKGMATNSQEAKRINVD